MNHSKYNGWHKSSHSNSSGNCVEVAFADWHKSSHSNASANCVEVAAADPAIGVRDSKQDGHGPVLEFTPAAWDAFLRAAKDGEFDL
jgi:Domain of unknown function (DUF397)